MGRINVTSQIFSGAFGPQQKFKVKVQTSNFKYSNIQIFKHSKNFGCTGVKAASKLQPE